MKHADMDTNTDTVKTSCTDSMNSLWYTLSVHHLTQHSMWYQLSVHHLTQHSALSTQHSMWYQLSVHHLSSELWGSQWSYTVCLLWAADTAL